MTLTSGKTVERSNPLLSVGRWVPARIPGLLWIPTLPLLLAGFCFPFAGLMAEDADTLRRKLSGRYAPYADWEAVLDPEALAGGERPERYWRPAGEIRRRRGAEAKPLEGLRLALDPGHVGGRWAETEGRHFQIEPGDFPVREGELVLEVARLAETELEALGAEVILLRRESGPVNPRPPAAYFFEVLEDGPFPREATWHGWKQFYRRIESEMAYQAVVPGELRERARLVNEEIRPDAVLSIHMNAAPWPEGERRLVESNHVHVLIFGAVGREELRSGNQAEELVVKLRNGSGPEELRLAGELARALAEKTGLPPSEYEGRNAVRPDEEHPYVWARNLLLLRKVRCPVVLLEAHVANSREVYPRLQEALAVRAEGRKPGPGDILREYAEGIVSGVRAAYGDGRESGEE